MDRTRRRYQRPGRDPQLSRRRFASMLGGTALGGVISPYVSPSISSPSVSAPSISGSTDSTFRAVELNHIAIRVSDVERSAEFYRRHLGLEVVLDRSFAKFLGCGPHFVALFQGGEPGLDHFAVTIPNYRQERTAERLREAGLEPILEENRTYFRDPDGLTVQLESAASWPGDGPRPDPPTFDE